MDTAGLGKKVGPLPVYGWGIALGGGLMLYRMLKGQQAPIVTTVGVDPNGQPISDLAPVSPALGSGVSPSSSLQLTRSDGSSIFFEGDPAGLGSLVDRFYAAPTATGGTGGDSTGGDPGNGSTGTTGGDSTGSTGTTQTPVRAASGVLLTDCRGFTADKPGPPIYEHYDPVVGDTKFYLDAGMTQEMGCPGGNYFGEVIHI